MEPETPRPRPLFGTASAACTVLIFIVPLLTYCAVVASGATVPQHRNDWGPFGAIILGVLAGLIGAGVAALGAVVAGAFALARGERHGWLGLVGLLIGGGVFALLAGGYLAGPG